MILIGFIFTLLIESVIAGLFIKKDLDTLVLYIFLVNLFTWPLANFFYGEGFNFYIIEVGVFLVEIFLIKCLFRLDFKKALLISLFANLVSASISFI